MRLDLPHELHRKRDAEGTTPAPPLEPTPLEQRRERLAEQMAARRPPDIAPPKRERSIEERQRTPLPDRSVERRPKRDRLPQQVIGLSLREEERRVLMDVGKFRVITTSDLAATVYDNNTARMTQDLRFLREQGLLEVDTVNARRDGRGGKVERIEVVTLTKSGRDLIRHTAQLPGGQKLYAGLVKPREVEHDTQIYRAYLKEAERVERSGGKNLRVQLDFELKAKVQKAIYATHKAEPECDLNKIKQQVAQQVDLPFVNGSIQIPDARIEYDRDQGSRSGHQDIEVLTAAYRPGHLRNKAQAGFHVYASASDRSTLSARAEDEHHLLDQILEL